MAGVGADLDKRRHRANKGGMLVQQGTAPYVLFEVHPLRPSRFAQRCKIVKLYLRALNGQGL